MKVLVTGATGMLGYDVYKESIKRSYNTFAVSRSSDGKGLIDPNLYTTLDLTNDIKVYDYILKLKPDVIIHCAAWTNVDAAEDISNHGQVLDINVNATKYIALAARQLKCKMVYISSDYVFNGTGTRPWKPEDKDFGALNFYGQSKLDGEFEVLDNIEKYFIIRTSWLFGLHGKNFVTTILDITKNRSSINVVSDQIGCVTYTNDLAKLILDMVETDKYGIYHATNSGGFISWYDFTKEIFMQVGCRGTEIIPVSSSKFITKAKRPLNSRLNINKITDSGFGKPHYWKYALNEYIEEAGLRVD